MSEILRTYWLQYVLIAAMSAAAFVLQVFGGVTILNAIRGVKGRYDVFGNGLAGIAAACAALVISSLLIFLARAVSVRVMVAYESLCASRLVRRVRDKLENVRDLPDAVVIKLLSKDCRFGGRIAQEIGGAVMPAGIALAAVPALFYLNFEATAIIAAVTALTVVPYRFVARWAGSVSRSFEEAAASDGAYKKEVLSGIRNGSLGKGPVEMPHPEFKRSYGKRLIAAHFGVLIGAVQTTVCLAALSLWFASRRNAGAKLEGIVLYALVAALAFGQIKTLPKVFTNFHMFQAYFQRAFVLIHGLEVGEHAQAAGAQIDPEDVIIEA